MRAFKKADKSPFYISLAGVSYCDGSYLIDRKNSPNAVIEFVERGEGVVECDGKSSAVSGGMIYFLPPHTNQRYFSDSENPMTKYFMDIRGELVALLIESFGLSHRYIYDGEGLESSFKQIPDIIHSVLAPDKMQARLQGLFIEIISALSQSSCDESYSQEALKLKSYLDSKSDKIVSMKELSSVIFRSPDYCNKLFLKEFKITPYEYQLKNKMSIAKILIRDTSLSVGQIAEKLGYSDQHYFSNLFKSRCGMSPLNWKKSKSL